MSCNGCDQCEACEPSEDKGMSKWDRFWSKFGALFDDMPGVFEEAVEGRIDGVTVSQVNNGHIQLRGKFKSLRINGYEVRVPEKVMRGLEP